MLYRVNFLIGKPEETKDVDSLYINASDRDASIEQAQTFAKKVFPDMEINLESVTTLPEGTIVTCVQSMEFVPKDATIEPPVVFTKSSVLLS